MIWGKQTRGFTLVELIIVITILAILGAIAFIAFNTFNKDASDNEVTGIFDTSSGSQSGGGSTPAGASCSASTIVGENATYSFSEIADLATGTASGTTSIANGNIEYTASLSCTDGTITIVSETEGTTTCDSGFTENSGACINPTPFTKIITGGRHSCAILSDSSVKCWGNNEYGQLGSATNNGTPIPNTTATLISGLTGVVDISLGRDHSCALLSDSSVKCWGDNEYGQLGNTTNVGTYNPNPTPTLVSGLTGVTDISLGEGYSCAILSDSTVKCWGINIDGELGNTINSGTDTPNPTPTLISGLTGVTDISLGRDHSCALLSDSNVKCWGSNKHGQLGHTTNIGTDNPNPTPTLISELSNVTNISLGSRHSCALLSDSSVKCWGWNEYGQLGSATNNGTTNPNTTPTLILGLTGVEDISLGHDYSCALLSDSSVKCWGYNYYGELGSSTNNGTFNSNPTPTLISGLTGVTNISLGSIHSCAISNGNALCWGYNKYGQLGHTTNSWTNNPNPTPLNVQM